ncbi:MAG: hypothetical protein JWO79_1949 [Actinomycetia bacterium]|nr:hypothetical protein [Actinomycetes bacterium]
MTRAAAGSGISGGVAVADGAGGLAAVGGLAAGRGLTVLAEAAWPGAGDSAPPSLAGFVVSSFSPIAAEAADRCLAQRYGSGPADPAEGTGTAVVVVSTRGDLATAVAVADSVEAGRPASPLLFFQSVPNAVVGYVARKWGLAGPVVCVGASGDPMAEGLDEAQLLIEDGDATAALILLVEPAAGAVPDSATALLVTARFEGDHDD